MNTLGIDVSHWDGNINWPTVKAGGQVKFALIKATEGTGFVDDKFAPNKAGCQSVDMPWGAYHYFKPAYDPAEQAKHFKATVGDGCSVYVVDVEESGINLANKLMVFLGGLDVPTKVVYTGPAFWNTNVGNDLYFAFFPLWIANYGVEHPYVPKPWTTYKIWQFSDRGVIPGVPSVVDLNWFNGDEQAVIDFFGNEAPEPPTPPDKVRVNVDALTIRSAPVVVADTVLGYTTRGKVWEVEAVVKDSMNRDWYRVGKAAYIAGWLCQIV